MPRQKLLILTYYWPPAGGAGVQRWLKFVKYLAQYDYDIHIYTTENPEAPAQDFSLLEDIPEGITIIKKPIWEPFGFYKKLTGKKGAFNAGFLKEEAPQKKISFGEKISLFIRANFFIPDAKMFWIKPSIKFLSSYIEQQDIDLIISTGPPHSLHLIAKKLKQRFNIKWLADLRDPWTNIDFYQDLPIIPIMDRYQKKLEKRVLHEADQIVVVGNEMKKEFREIDPNCPIEVITNGFDSPISENTNLDQEFSILHIGSINAHRSHESFYKALYELCNENGIFKQNFKLKLIGKVDFKARNFIKEYHLEKSTEIVRYLPYNELGELQTTAHILYLPINNTRNAKGILTGKFFEYLAAKRPIIAQGPIDGDIANILNETHSGQILDFDNVDGLKSAIMEEFKNFQSGNNSFRSQNIEKYSRENLSQKLHQLIQMLMK